MKFDVLIRRGEGPFWGTLKRVVLGVLRFHLPVVPLTRPFFRMLYGLHVMMREIILMGLRVLWYEPLFRSQCASVGRGLMMEKLPFLTGRGTIVIGDYVTLTGKSAFTFGNRWNDKPELVIGEHTSINHGAGIAVAQSVRIGRYCLLAGGVSIADYDGHPTDAVLRRTSPAPREGIRPVVIGDDVWIGAGAKILKGVTIGDRAIVGAAAVVTSSIPPDVVVAGNPARVVKRLVEPVPDPARTSLVKPDLQRDQDPR